MKKISALKVLRECGMLQADRKLPVPPSRWLYFSAAFSPDGKYVVSGSADGTARVMEVGTKQEISRMSHENGVSAVAFSPDGITLLQPVAKNIRVAFALLV
ncbi:MAG: hypothetical protein HS126_37245 [Anaerolineales bacterium]|nr:hypothetical protein [Anaerolineales bacterium]